MKTLKAEHLAKSYNGREVVKDVSMEVSSGQIVGLLGPNGAGKTTCFYMIVNLVQADKGTITIDGEDISHLPMHGRARKGIGYLPQEASIFRKLSVADNIMAILETRKELDRSAREAQLELLLEDFHITHIRDNLGMSLSGGERRRVEMARALINKPSILLLDEPFAGIDPIAVSDIRKFIVNIQNDGIGILITDHNVRETLTICDRAYLISDGKILLNGTPEQIVNNAEARATYFGEDFVL